MQHELRKDYITDNWVVIAPARGMKPYHPEICPFCPENIVSEAGQIVLKLNKQGKERDPWQVLIVENRFPVTHPSKFKVTGLGTLFTKAPAHGYSEVVVETPEHNQQLHQQSVDNIVLVFKAIQRRVKKLSERQKTDYILIGKAYGPLKGSLDHPHMQIITYPKLPKGISEEIRGFNEYSRVNKRCIFCDVLEKESKSTRKITENKEFIAFAPFASVNPYEVWIFPKKHTRDLNEFNDEKLFSLAEVLKGIISKMDRLFPNLSYEFVVHERPSSLKMQDFHFHIEIYPAIKPNQKGKDFGILPNAVPPERAASVLRK